jgi:hypothetical protein
MARSSTTWVQGQSGYPKGVSQVVKLRKSQKALLQFKSDIEVAIKVAMMDMIARNFEGTPKLREQARRVIKNVLSHDNMTERLDRKIGITITSILELEAKLQTEFDNIDRM